VLELDLKDKMKASLEMSDEKAATQEKSTVKLKSTVNVIDTDVNELKRENQLLREYLLDIQTGTMRRKIWCFPELKRMKIQRVW
jgi:hypothetical protein